MRLWIQMALTVSMVGLLVSGPTQQGSLQYSIDVTDRTRARFHVTLRLPAVEVALRLVMPASTPGGLIQNHARYVAKFRARGEQNQILHSYRVDKQTWQIDVPRKQSITVSYDVSVNNTDKLRLTTNWLGKDGGFFHGTTVFMFARDYLDQPISLELKTPEAWTIVMPLPRGARANSFLAAN